MFARLVLVIGVFAYLPTARAQFLPGALTAQTCPFPQQMAPGAFNPMDNQSRAQALRERAHKEGALIDKRMGVLEKQIDQDRAPLYSRLWGSTVDVLIEHMKNRNPGGGIEVNCGDVVPAPGPGPGTIPESAVTEGTHDGASNDMTDVNRMPAAVTESAPVASNPKAKEVSAPKTSQTTDGMPPQKQAHFQPPPPPPPQQRWAPGRHGRQVLCSSQGYNKWAQYALDNGDVDSSICSDDFQGIQLPGPTPANVDMCEKSLDRLRLDFHRLAMLHERKLRLEADAEAAEHDNADAATEGGFGCIACQRENMSLKLGGLFNMLHAMQFRMGPPMYPMPSYSPFGSMMYGAPGFGFPNVYNGGYGMGPGAIGLGAYGCNGVNNPNLFGPPPWAMPNGMPMYGLGAGPGWGMPQVPQPIMAPMSGPAVMPALGGGFPPGYRPAFGGGFPPGFRPAIGMPGMPGMGMPGMPMGGVMPGGFRPGGPVMPYTAGGMPGMPGAMPGMPGAMPGMPGAIPGAMPGMGMPGGFRPGPPVAPIYGSPLAGQVGYMGAQLGNFGAGGLAVPPSPVLPVMGTYGGASTGAGYFGAGSVLGIPPLGGSVLPSMPPPVEPLAPF